MEEEEEEEEQRPATQRVSISVQYSLVPSISKEQPPKSSTRYANVCNKEATTKKRNNTGTVAVSKRFSFLLCVWLVSIHAALVVVVN